MLVLELGDWKVSSRILLDRFGYENMPKKYPPIYEFQFDWM